MRAVTMVEAVKMRPRRQHLPRGISASAAWGACQKPCLIRTSQGPVLQVLGRTGLTGSLVS